MPKRAYDIRIYTPGKFYNIMIGNSKDIYISRSISADAGKLITDPLHRILQFCRICLRPLFHILRTIMHANTQDTGQYQNQASSHDLSPGYYKCTWNL